MIKAINKTILQWLEGWKGKCEDNFCRLNHSCGECSSQEECENAYQAIKKSIKLVYDNRI